MNDVLMFGFTVQNVTVIVIFASIAILGVLSFDRDQRRK